MPNLCETLACVNGAIANDRLLAYNVRVDEKELAIDLPVHLHGKNINYR
jgi:hypothetical protein